MIELLSTNASGDQTRSGTRVFSDTTAPDLKIERLGSISTDKTVLVKGVSEPGSKVSINSQPITVETDGAFEHALPIEGYLSKSIVITAKDDAGNETTYSSEVMNQAVDAFVKVELRPVAEDSGKLSADGEELSLPAGSKPLLELVGVDKNGVSTVIDPNQVGWSVILGDANGSVSEQGQVEADYEGELVVKASYAVTTEYAFEDTLIVKVGKKTDAPQPSKPNYDDWYIPPTPPSPDGEGSSGDSQQQADKVVEETLQNILKRLIELEQDVEFVTSAKLVPNQETIVKIRDRAALRFAAQPMLENVGLGIGAVRNPKAYEGEALKVIGDIYEFKFDKPIKLKEPAELTIRFNLEEIRDPSKAGIYWYNERTKKWEYIGGVMNPLAGTITATLPHFSKYALLYNTDMKDFKDINNRWSRDMVYRLASIGAVNGINQGDDLIFEPTRSITRQEFAKIVVGAMGTELSSSELPTEYADRDDVAPWAVPYMSTALTNQWLGGTSSQNELYLAPSVPISRAEAIAIIGRILKAGESKAAGAGSSFLDRSKIPDWANEYVPVLVEQGIISGYPDGTLRPNNEITREEAVAMISRMIDAK